MGKLSRTKGHAFERWVAIQLRKVFPEAKRQLEYQISDCVGVDLANTGDYKIQCKREKKYSSVVAIEEVQICPIHGGIPVLITKGDGKEPLAVLPFTEFVRLLKKAGSNGQS